MVAERRRRVVGCGALHVLWEDLAEVRTLAVDPALRGRGIGHAVLPALLDQARASSASQRLFCLTFEIGFFGRHGFVEIEGTRSRTRSTSSCCSPTTRASRSSSTSSG